MNMSNYLLFPSERNLLHQGIEKYSGNKRHDHPMKAKQQKRRWTVLQKCNEASYFSDNNNILNDRGQEASLRKGTAPRDRVVVSMVWLTDIWVVAI
jgi:hypothetical protein